MGTNETTEDNDVAVPDTIVATLAESDSIALRYKKDELSLVKIGLVTSVLGLMFLGWQLWILNDQTATLSRSVLNQEAAFSSSEKMDNFDIKRFLLERFTPDISLEPVLGKYSEVSKSFVFGWNITNNGDNRLAAADKFYFDVVRCFNRDIWDGSKWTPRKTIQQDDENSLPGIDYLKDGVGWIDLHPASSRLIHFNLPFSDASYANFQVGEKVAVEFFSAVYDPDQSFFRNELEALKFRYGRQITSAGRSLEFPAIVQTLWRIEMFELKADGWSTVENDRACTVFLSE